MDVIQSENEIIIKMSKDIANDFFDELYFMLEVANPNLYVPYEETESQGYNLSEELFEKLMALTKFTPPFIK